MAEENATQQELSTILRKAVQQSLHQGFLSKGLHEVCKSVEAQKAKVVILSNNCDNKDIVALVKALCKEYKVPILPIDEGQTLGLWLGLCKYDSNKQVRKQRRCSVLAIREFPEDFSEEDIKFIMASV